MSDFLFVLKALVATVVLVFFMQIRIGPSTIEHHTLAWLQNSFLVDNLRFVANGAVKVVSQGYEYVSSFVNKNVGAPSEQAEGHESRVERLRPRRSEAYYREQERKKLEQEGPTGDEID